jgi:hypothetical protein
LKHKIGHVLAQYDLNYVGGLLNQTNKKEVHNGYIACKINSNFHFKYSNYIDNKIVTYKNKFLCCKY